MLTTKIEILAGEEKKRCTGSVGVGREENALVGDGLQLRTAMATRSCSEAQRGPVLCRILEWSRERSMNMRKQVQKRR